MKNNFQDPNSTLIPPLRVYIEACWQKNFIIGFIRRARVAPSLRNFHHIWRKCNILFTCDLPASAPTLLWSLPSWLMVLGEKWAGRAGPFPYRINESLLRGRGLLFVVLLKPRTFLCIFFLWNPTNWACHWQPLIYYQLNFLADNKSAPPKIITITFMLLMIFDEYEVGKIASLILFFLNKLWSFWWWYIWQNFVCISHEFI